VRVRITKAPVEQELDGVPLDCLTVGSVRDVSASIATWLIAQGYAVPEMRSTNDDELFRSPEKGPLPRLGR
jgi:hypothetical protein